MKKRCIRERCGMLSVQAFSSRARDAYRTSSSFPALGTIAPTADTLPTHSPFRFPLLHSSNTARRTNGTKCSFELALTLNVIIETTKLCTSQVLVHYVTSSICYR